MNCAIKKHGLIAPRLLLLRRSMLPVISILFITTFHGARASGPAVATPGNGGTTPAVMSPAEIAAIKVPKGFHLAQLPWRYGHDLYNPASVNVPLAQPWYQPILEAQRHRAQLAQAGAQPTAATVQILSNFSDAVPIKVHEISATHYALTFTGPLIWPPATGKLQNWFVFRVRGVKGKTIRFDLTNGNIKWWQTLNPVYSYCNSLSSLRSMAAIAVPHPTATQAFDGAILPDTSGQRWHFIGCSSKTRWFAVQ